MRKRGQRFHGAEGYKCHRTGQKGTFGNDRYILYLDCDNESTLTLECGGGDRDIYICQNILNCVF